MVRKKILGTLLASALGWTAVSWGAPDATVFDSAPAQHVPVIAINPAPADAPLRRLMVEERMGVPRTNDLVRVPLFFHAGECKNPNDLAIYTADDTGKTKPIPYQADDIRRAEDGSVARMHVYFFTDLAKWERKPFIITSGKNPAAPSVGLNEAGDDVTFSAQDLTITFRAKGPLAGGFVSIKTPFAQVAAREGVLGPRVKLARQAGDEQKLKMLHTNPIGYDNPDSLEVRELKYAAGPVFGKLRVRMGPKGVPDSIESTYLIPQRGTQIVAIHRMMPDEPSTTETVSAAWPNYLQGMAKFGNDSKTPRVVKIPAGVRPLTRRIHGFNVEAAVSDESKFSFMNVPEVVWGDHGVYAHDTGELVFMGPGNMKRNGDSNSKSLRTWWFGMRYVLAPTTDENALYDIARANMQPLTAIVDEPAITRADLNAQGAAVAKRFYEIQYWGRGWQQDGAMEYLQGKEAAWQKRVKGKANEPTKPQKSDETNWEHKTPAWVREQLAAGGTWPLKRPKGSDKDVAGGVEPYPLGYGAGSVPVFAKMEPSERFNKIVHATAKASMWTNGGLYSNGWPRITAFSNAYNMQIGSVIYGLYGGKATGDQELVRFYRDVTRSPGAIAIYGRGLRCYSGDVRRAEPSDSLYQAISDMWLRVAELTADENLMMHPTVYGRFSDAVDVTGDLQHRSPGTAPGDALDYRGNFFRTQIHDHRWEAWDALPNVQVLRDPTAEQPAGLSDIVYAYHFRSQGKVNWSELMNYFHPVAMLNTVAATYNPPTLPALPQNVKVAPGSQGVTVSWSAVPGAVGYRIYRAAQEGDPLTFVNSPYGPNAKELAKGTSFADPEGKPTDFYFVTAIDDKGFESHWFPDEPKPITAKAK